MVLFLILFLFLFNTRDVNAQIPLFYQLSEAYKPQALFKKTIAVPAPTKIPTPIITPTKINGKILGTTTTQITITNQKPAIGGDGKVYTIAVLGDSMIDTIGTTQLDTSLKRYFPNHKFNIINYGVGASNIEYALYRLTNNYKYLDREYPSLISQNPDLIVIESFAYNNYGNTQSGIDKQWLTLGAITTILKEKLPNCKIVLAATIAPNSVFFGNNNPNTKFSSFEKIEKTNTVKLYLQNLINFSNSQKFPLADAYHPSLVKNDGFNELINPDDNIHPSELGKEFFCDTIAKTIFDNKLL